MAYSYWLNGGAKSPSRGSRRPRQSAWSAWVRVVQIHPNNACAATKTTLCSWDRGLELLKKPPVQAIARDAFLVTALGRLGLNGPVAYRTYVSLSLAEDAVPGCQFGIKRFDMKMEFRVLMALLASCVLAPLAQADPLLTFPLKIGEHRLRAEVASTPEERQKGLMHRRSMPENHGMVFVFERTGLWGMWMKNTYIPLSVAFISEDGRILNIEDMEPHTEDSHSASAPARYALEVKKGWFRKHKISAGQRVEGLTTLPRSQ